MRENLIIVCSSNHTFLLSELEAASKKFKKVILLYYKDNLMNIESCFDNYSNVVCIALRKKGKFSSVLQSIKYFNIKVINEIKENRKKHKKLDLLYWKELVSMFCLYDQILKKCKRLQLDKNQEKTVVMSCWFGSNAWPVAKLKEKYPNIKCFSLAHSVEVDYRKNKYIDCFFRGYTHEKLDLISFISKSVKDEYVDMYANPNLWRTDNICVDYLCTRKLCLECNSVQRKKEFVLLSCSHCVPVKNLFLICEALSLISDMRIHWIHFGAGPLLNALREKAQSIENSNVSCEINGAQDNQYIHTYLSQNHVDAFINVSTSEGIPVTLMEATAYGIPLIATNVGGNAEIVNNNNGILLSNESNAAEVANAIRQIYDMDEDAIRRMREESLKTFEEKFNFENRRLEFYGRITSL